MASHSRASPPRPSREAVCSLAQEGEDVEFPYGGHAAGLFLRKRPAVREKLELGEFGVHGGGVRKERLGEDVHAAGFQFKADGLGPLLDMAAHGAGFEAR